MRKRTTSPRTVTSSPRAPDKSREIFDRAVRIFKEKGYHAASVQDIADAVGLQKGSLYHYITGKEDLLFQIFDQGSRPLTRRLEEIVAAPDPAPVKLERAIEAHLSELCGQLDIFTVYLSERRALDGRHHSRVRAQGQRHARLLEQIIRQGIRSGEFRPVNPPMTARALLGMCNWLYQWYSPEGHLSPEAIAHIFSDLVLSGMRQDASGKTTDPDSATDH